MPWCMQSGVFKVRAVFWVERKSVSDWREGGESKKGFACMHV